MDTNRLMYEMVQKGFKSDYINTCILYADHLNCERLPVIFDFIHFSKLLAISGQELYFTINNIEFEYRRKYIKKKNGNQRELSIPSANMKYIQKWMLDKILNRIKYSTSATGFTRNLSIYDNAKEHVNKECIINLDIQDFFPSIKYPRVYSIFKRCGYSKKLCVIFSNLCTYRKSLPQGAPTSPILSNLVAYQLDIRLKALADKLNASYTRYADDITISGSRNILKCFKLIKKIVFEEGFQLNQSKQRIHYMFFASRNSPLLQLFFPTTRWGILSIILSGFYLLKMSLKSLSYLLKNILFRVFTDMSFIINKRLSQFQK